MKWTFENGHGKFFQQQVSQGSKSPSKKGPASFAVVFSPGVFFVVFWGFGSPEVSCETAL